MHQHNAVIEASDCAFSDKSQYFFDILVARNYQVFPVRQLTFPRAQANNYQLRITYANWPSISSESLQLVKHSDNDAIEAIKHRCGDANNSLTLTLEASKTDRIKPSMQSRQQLSRKVFELKVKKKKMGSFWEVSDEGCLANLGESWRIEEGH